MWILLPMMSLLIRVIVGSPKNHGTTLSDVTIIPENRIGKPTVDIWKVWKQLKGERSKEEIDRNTVLLTDDPKENNSLGNMPIDVEETDFNVKVVSKRGETIGTWLELPTKDMRLEEIFQARKNPRFYWRGDKRQSPYGPGVSSIHRPIPESFNSWGGKRGTDYFRSNAELQTKRTYNQDTSKDECIKREAETKNIRFDRWAGKRGKKSNDRKSFLVLWKNPNNFHILDIFKDGFVMRQNDRKSNDEKHTDQMKHWVSTMYKKWENNSIPLHVYNETNDDDYTTEKEITDINNWLTSLIPGKKSGQDQQHYLRYGPWQGKRTFRLGNEHFAMPIAYSAKRDNSFLSSSSNMSN